MSRRILTLIMISALAIGLAACGSSSKKSTPPANSGGSGAAITVDSAFKFTVKPVTAGATVTVSNTSSTTHTVTSDDGKFDVSIDGGKTATFTAPAAGTYKFHCKIHNSMTGTLTVT